MKSCKVPGIELDAEDAAESKLIELWVTDGKHVNTATCTTLSLLGAG